MKPKQTLYYIIALFTLFAFYSCNLEKNKDLLYINPVFIQTERVKMTDVIEDIQYTRLESDVLLGTIYKIKASGEYLYIYSGNGTITLFDYNGNYIKKISHKGKGPGEISSYTDFDVNANDNSVLVLDNKKKIKIISFNDELINEFSFEANASFDGISFYKNDIYVFNNFSFIQNTRNWEVYNVLGNKISEKLGTTEFFQVMAKPNITNYFKFNSNLYYWNSLNDTIFKITEHSYYPGFFFSEGSYRMKKEDLSSHEAFMGMKAGLLTSVFGSGNYLVFNYNLIKDRKKLIGLFYTQTGEYDLAHLASNTDSDFGIYNDWDGGLAFEPKWQINSQDSGETLVSVINAFQLTELVASEAFKNSTPKYPEKKRELEKLANNLNENDNPVLMLVKLKE